LKTGLKVLERDLSSIAQGLKNELKFSIKVHTGMRSIVSSAILAGIAISSGTST
jgi:hypothetical protein